MATLTAGDSAELYCPLDSAITLTPGLNGEIDFRCSTRVGASVHPRLVYSAETISIPAGSTVFLRAVGADASYSGDVTLTEPGGGILTFAEVVEEVLAHPTATTTVLTGAGLYSHYRCTTATGNITIYDNTAASGKVLVPTTALALGSFPIFGSGNPNRLAVSTGVTVVLSGAAVVYVGAGEG